MDRFGRIAALLLMPALCACTHSVHLSHYSDFTSTYKPAQKGNWITAESEQFVILGFTTSTEYVNEAYSRLQSQCEGGMIQGIETQFSTDHGFFSWTNRIHMTGLCLQAKTS